jgi:hypothetical protein
MRKSDIREIIDLTGIKESGLSGTSWTSKIICMSRTSRNNGYRSREGNYRRRGHQGNYRHHAEIIGITNIGVSKNIMVVMSMSYF